MCTPCKTSGDEHSPFSAAACQLTEINERIAQAQAHLAGLVADMRQSGASQQQLEAALELLEDLQLEALRARETVDGATESLRSASQFGELDILTSLPNRLLLLDRLNHGIDTAKRRNKKLAVLFIDLDDFKIINDTHGHAVGDQVLVHVARCITAAVRRADTVSRMGGDEFVVLLTELNEAADAAIAAEKILALLHERCELGGRVLHLGASIGVSLYPSDGSDAAALMERADAAMYCVKRRGGGGFSFSVGP